MPTPSLKIDHARYVVTVDPQRRIIQDGSVLIEDGRIRQVGKAAELAGARADRTIDARHMVVTPGFVNGHMHISYGHVVRGIFPDDVGSPLPTVFKLQMAMTEEEEYASTLLGLVELLKNGTVGFVDPGSTKFPDACLQAYEDAGIRVILGECVTDQEAPFPLPRFETKEAVARSAAFIDKWHGRARRPHARVGHAVLAGDVQRRPAARPQARGRRARHVAHAPPQQRRQGAPGLPGRHQSPSPTEYLESLGVLGPNVVLAHVLGIDAAEIDAMARTGTTAAMCPVTAAKGARGVGEHGRMPELLAKGREGRARLRLAEQLATISTSCAR